jgi:hypothetical protein
MSRPNQRSAKLHFSTAGTQDGWATANKPDMLMPDQNKLNSLQNDDHLMFTVTAIIFSLLNDYT